MKELVPLKILTYFLENPYEEVYLRDVSRKLKISPFAVKKYLDFFVKDQLVLDERKANLRYFKLNIHNYVVKSLKISLNLKKIQDSGLINYLIKEVPALTSIVLFGSCAKGEDTLESDIDLIIIGKEKRDNFLKLSSYVDKLGREINQHLFSWNEWNKNLKNNLAFYQDVVIYGITLYGELPLIQDGNTNN